MQTFAISQGGFKEIKKKILITRIPIMIIAVAGGIAISTINSKNKADDVNVLPFVIPLMAVAVGFGLYKGINRQKALFESYTLTISDNLVTRKQLNTPTISIYFSEIKEIVRNANGSFTIKGKTAADLIVIPAQIEDYAALEAALQQIQPIVAKGSTTFLQKYQSVAGLLSVGLMVCVYAVNNKIIVGLTGTALVALMIWSLIKIQGNKNIDHKTKQSSWLILIVLVSVIGVMIFKLTGLTDMNKH